MLNQAQNIGEKASNSIMGVFKSKDQKSKEKYEKDVDNL